jgi:hypothetical protein
MMGDALHICRFEAGLSTSEQKENGSPTNRHSHTQPALLEYICVYNCSYKRGNDMRFVSVRDLREKSAKIWQEPSLRRRVRSFVNCVWRG